MNLKEALKNLNIKKRSLSVILSSKEKRQMVYLLVLMVASAAAQVLGVGVVGPFVALAADPGVADQSRFFSWLQMLIPINDPVLFIIIVGLLVLVALIFSNMAIAITLYITIHYIQNIRYNLALRLFSRYLSQPYVFFIGRNTSELSKNILNDVNWAVSFVVMPFLIAVSKVLIVFAIIVFLFISSPVIAFIAVITVGFAYLAVARVSKRRLAINGHAITQGVTRMYKAAAEAFGSPKDCKILGLEASYIDQFGAAAQDMTNHQASSDVIGTLPRYLIESLVFGLVVGITLYLVISTDEFSSAIGGLSVFVLAGYRLMPAVQTIFQSVSQVRTYGRMLDSLADDIATVPCIANENSQRRLEWKNQVSLRNVSYLYPGATDFSLKDISLTFPKNTTVGIVGATGCGKTTLIDVLMGLLDADSGKIFVDEYELKSGTIRQWQNGIGYVPQHIFLVDDTVASNVAFGIPADEVDMSAVESACRIANIHNFIHSELPDGYHTVVGERGIRLSGGQRQRIGIARALYRDPDFLVLDEATSALDTVTETVVVDAIQNLMHRKTIVMIAHRIATLEECDIIHVMEQGRVVASGTYSQLIANDDTFRRLAKHRENAR